MSLVKKICFCIVLLVVLHLGVLAYLIGTTSGLHLLLNRVASLVPGLEIASISGSWCNLTVKQLRYQMPGITVDAGELHLALDFSCLRQRQLCINDLIMQNIMISVRTTELGLPVTTALKTSNGGLLTIPYQLILRHLELNNIQVKMDNSHIALDKFITGFHLEGNNLTVNPTHIAGLLVELPTTAKEEIHSRPLLTETLRGLLVKPLLLQLSSFTLPLNLKLMSVDGENLHLTGYYNLFITHLRLQAATQDQYAELTLLDIDSPYGLLNATGHVELSGHWPISVMINTTLNSTPLKDEKIKLTMDGELCDELHASLSLSGPLTVQLALKMRLAQSGPPPITLMLDRQFLQWPLTGIPQYRALGMLLQLNRETQDYRLALKTDLSDEELPSVDVTLDSKGNTDSFMLPRLRLAALRGSEDLSAIIDWQHVINWRSDLMSNGINTIGQYTYWPMHLERKINSSSRFYDGNWQLQMPELDLCYQIRQNMLIAKGSLCCNSSSGQWYVFQLLLVLGLNQLIVKGKLNDTFTLDAVLNAPALNGALPDLKGWASGNIKLRGNFHTPQLLMNLGMHALHWGGMSIERITLHGDVRFSDSIRGNVQLQLDCLQRGLLSIKQLTMKLIGDEKQHQLKIAIQGEPVSGQLQLNGSFDRQQQRWQGTLSQTRLDTPVGEWHLTHAITLDYQVATQNLFMGPHCWQNSNAQICMPHSINLGESGQVNMLLNRFDLEMMKPMLPTKTHASGVFSGRADMRWNARGCSLNGKVVLMGNGVKVSQTVHGKTLSVDFKTMILNATLDKDLVYLDWLIKTAGNGQLNGQVQIADPQSRRRLSGNININNLSLLMLKPLLSRGESVDGLFNAALRLGGNIQRPQLYGHLGLKSLVIRGPFMPFSMTDSWLALFFSGTSSVLHGLINTTHGQVNLTGDADWSKIEAWRVRINAQGNRVRITVPPMIRLDMSPDIMSEVTPTLFTLNGKIDIPWSRIEVKDILQSAVGISSDEVLLDNNLQPILNNASSSKIPIISNLLVKVGTDVRLDAFGLKAKLTGDLKLAYNKQGLGINGQIDIPSGRFHAYGQDLIVNKGQLLFSGPVDQPYLNIEAVRNPDYTEDNITVGVRVIGLTDQLKVEVFSDPIRSQQETLSYLLRGQSLDTLGADSNMLTSILISVGVAQSGQVISKIGRAFGVSDLALDTQGVGDKSKVVVSGYVVPGLQIKYGVGIFDSLATLTLRYRLMPRFYLEVVSGLNQALDLLYQIEF